MRSGLLVLVAGFALVGSAFGKGHQSDKPLTADQAVAEAEQALDTGRVGEAAKIAERLTKTHGLPKELATRSDIVLARTNLMLGQYAPSEKIFARIHKSAPKDVRITEWYARSLEGLGKTDAAFALFQEVLAKDELAEGDSYWALAQLERQKGKDKEALEHAELALKKPIMLQSDELDLAIQSFIKELRPAGDAQKPAAATPTPVDTTHGTTASGAGAPTKSAP